MKWVKSRQEIENYLKMMPPADEERIKSLFYNSDDNPTDFDEYATYKDTGKFHRWGYEVEIKDSYRRQHPILDVYEIYAGGWIDFWDTQVRQESTDHALYFKIRKCDGKTYMDAYIRQLKRVDKLNVYVNVSNPPTSTDPPPPPPGRPW